MNDGLSFKSTASLSEEDSAAIQSGLQAFNIAEGQIEEVVPLSIVARIDQNEIVGGLLARTWGSCCEVMILWVHEDRRMQGIGRRLMADVEREAMSRGCERVYLDTFTFQAPEFYASLGYAQDHVISGFPRGIQKVYMSKAL